MDKLSIGLQIELKDGSMVTITGIKEEITFEKIENETTISQTLSLSDFNKLTSSHEPKVGLKFIDQDKCFSEILEVNPNLILYKKQYGAELWNSSMTIEEFYERVKSSQIKVV